MRTTVYSVLMVLVVAAVAGFVSISSGDETATVNADCLTSYDWCD